jgi:hypothetical protein
VNAAVTMITITPDKARQMLEGNIYNRPVSSKRVAEYSKEMREGKWLFNGDAIRISPEGRLLDGQHRLHACVHSNSSFQSLLVIVPDEAFDTIDQGKKRSPGDILAASGIANANNVAAGVRWIYEIRSKGRVQLTSSQVHDFVHDNPYIIECASYVMGIGRKGPAPASVLTGLLFLFSQKDTAAAYKFMKDFSEGANLDTRDPVHVVRNKLISSALSSKKQTMPNAEIAALLIRAWNARRIGKGLTVIRGQIASPATGVLTFPEII